MTLSEDIPYKNENVTPHDPPWLLKLESGETTLDQGNALPLWAIYTMMRKRRISREEVAQELGLSKQRVQAMILEGGWSHERIEKAITAITDKRHAAHHQDDERHPASCAVYLSSGEDSLQARKQSEAFYEDKVNNPHLWRLEDTDGKEDLRSTRKEQRLRSDHEEQGQEKDQSVQRVAQKRS